MLYYLTQIKLKNKIIIYLQNNKMGLETDVVTSRPGEGSHPRPTEPCSVTGTACEVLKSCFCEAFILLNINFKSQNLLKN